MAAKHTTASTPAAPLQLASAVAAVSDAALAAIDLRRHDATHPRLGALDHVSVHPVPEGLDLGPAVTTTAADGSSTSRFSAEALAGAAAAAAAAGERAASGAHASSSGGGSGSSSSGLQEAAALARSIGARLAAGSPPLPVYLYGSAHPEGRRLADIRRQLGALRTSASRKRM